jgi:hypothetical protein
MSLWPSLAMYWGQVNPKAWTERRKTPNGNPGRHTELNVKRCASFWKDSARNNVEKNCTSLISESASKTT